MRNLNLILSFLVSKLSRGINFFLFIYIPLLLVFSVAKSQTADFSFNTGSGNFCVPANINFSGTFSETPKKVIWSLGISGETSQDLSPTFVFTSAGTYTIKLSVLFRNKLVVVEKNLQVFGSPSLTLNVSRNYLCQPGQVIFSARSFQRVSSAIWSMSDGSPPVTNSDTTFKYSFSNMGIYTPSVTIRDVNGCTATGSSNVVLQQLTGSIRVTPTVGCLPASVGLKASINVPNGDAVANYNWTLGDGSPALSGITDSIQHTYSNPLPDRPAVRVTTTEGCVNTFLADSVFFGNRPGPISLITAKPTQCFSEPISVSATSANANIVVWQLGNGSKDSSRQFVFSAKPTQRGVFWVKATPYSNGCAGPTDSVKIDVIGVQANFRFQNTCQNKETFSFRNTSSGVVNQFRWSFEGANITSVNANPTVTFPEQGVFQVKMVVFQNSTNCFDSLTQTIYTYKPKLITGDSFVCRNSIYTAKVSGGPQAQFATYTWNIGGWPPTTDRDSIRSFQPNRHGLFNNSVVIRLSGSYCNDTLRGDFPVRVAGPVAGYSGPTQICADAPLVLQSNAVPAFLQDTLKNWYWEIGNALFVDSKELPDPFFIKNSGNFRIIQRVTDINGCMDEFRSNIKSRLNPIISVFPTDVTFCQGSSFDLEAFSEHALQWTPSGVFDCDTCTNVRVTPAGSGVIYVSTSDSLGCTSLDSVRLTARVPYTFNPPLSDTGFCAGGSVQLNSGLNGVRLEWSPPDGLSNPNLPNPIASPLATTLYRLEAVDSFYCFPNSIDVLVEVNPLPGIEPIPEVIAAYNSRFQFALNYTTPDIVSYTWLPADQLSCTNCISPFITANESKTYTLRLVSSKGCITETTAKVIIECNPDNLLIPSAFTPNNDGLNERFFPIGRGITKINKFQIFNRIGELIFSRTDFVPGDSSFGWDGTYKQKPQPSGAFVYVVEALCDLGKAIKKKGTVLLLR